MRYFLVILLFFSFFTSAISQDESELDSLYTALETSETDTGRALIYGEIAYLYAMTTPDSANYYGNQGLTLSRQLDYTKGMLRSSWSLGVSAVLTNNLPKAKEYFLLALDAAASLPSVYDQAVALRILGNIEFTMGEYPFALDYWNKGNNLAIEHQFTEMIPEFYHNIGYVYWEIQEYERAKEYLELSHKTTYDYQIADLYPNSLNNLAMVAFHEKDYDQTKSYARGIIGMLDSLPNAVNFLPVAYEYLGKASYALQEYDSSLYFYREMLSQLEGLGEMYMGPKSLEETFAYKGIGQTYLQLNQLSKAEENLLQAFDLAVGLDSPREKSSIALSLSEVYEKMGKLGKALEYYKIHKSDSDSVFNEEKIREVTQTRMEAEFEKIQKEHELEDLQRETAQKRKELIYIIVIISIVLILVIIVLLYRLQGSRMERLELERKNLKQSMDFKNQELASNVLYLMKKNELLLKISKGLKKAKLGTRSTTNEAIDEIIREVEISSKDLGWEEFELRLKEVHADFFSNLNKRYPDLSPNEQRLAALLKLNMSTKDISAITFQSVNSIRMARSRMRKKMKVDEGENLLGVLNQL